MKQMAVEKKAWRIFVGILGVVILWVIINALYSLYEAHKYTKPGTVVGTSHGGMHVYSQIKETVQPAYVFLNGFGGGSTYYDFKMLWGPLSEITTIVTIDYLGYGMSNTTNTERTVENIASEIDEALTKEGVSGPYIMISHSLGGFYSTGYALQYPDKVDSLVFIDNSVPSEVLSAGIAELEDYKQMQPLVKLLRAGGLLRFVSKNDTPGLDSDEEKANTYYLNKMYLNKTVINEIDHTQRNAQYLLDKPISDSIPMLVLVSEQNDHAEEWILYHKDFLNQNASSEMILHDTGHYIHYEEPLEVLREILTFSGR